MSIQRLKLLFPGFEKEAEAILEQEPILVPARKDLEYITEHNKIKMVPLTVATLKKYDVLCEEEKWRMDYEVTVASINIYSSVRDLNQQLTRIMIRWPSAKLSTAYPCAFAVVDRAVINDFDLDPVYNVTFEKLLALSKHSNQIKFELERQEKITKLEDQLRKLRETP